ALENPVLQQVAAAFRRLKEHFQVVKTSDLILNASASLEETMDGRADVTTDAALAWLDQQGERPFFLWVHYYDPHYPDTPPAPYDRMYDPDYEGGLDGSMATVKAIQSGALRPEVEGADAAHLTALYRGEISFTDAQIGRLLSKLDARGLRQRTLIALTAD